MKVALVGCPFQDTSMPSLEMARMAGVVRQQGYDLTVRDLNIELWHALKDTPERDCWSSHARMLWLLPVMTGQFWRRHSQRWDGAVRDILAGRPDLVAVSLSAGSLYSGLFFSEALKRARPELFVIAVNPHLLLGTEEGNNWKVTAFLDNSALDGVLMGPVPDTLTLVLRDLSGLGELKPREGFHCKQGGKVMIGRAPLPLNRPDRLPFADFASFPLELYDRPYTLPLNARWACSCAVCARTGLGTTPVWSGTRLFLEAGYLRRRLPRKACFSVMVQDEPSRSALRRFCDLIQEGPRMNGGLPWRWELRAGTAFAADAARLAESAGCEKLVVHRDFKEPRQTPAPPGPSMRVEERVAFDPFAPGPAGDADVTDARPPEGWKDFFVDDDRLDSACLPGLVLSSKSQWMDFDDHRAEETFPFRGVLNGRFDDPDAWYALHQIQNLMICGERPAQALRACLGLARRPAWLVSLILRLYAPDMARLGSALKRLWAAEEILKDLPPGTREAIWLDSPTLRSAHARLKDFQRHRYLMKVYRENLQQRASRYLIAAGARASQLTIGRARLHGGPDVNRFVLLWGNDRLSPEQLLLLCDSFFALFPDRLARWRDWSGPLLNGGLRGSSEDDAASGRPGGGRPDDDKNRKAAFERPLGLRKVVGS